MRTFSVVFEEPWQSGGVPGDCKKGSVTLIFKQGRKDGPGNYRALSFTSVLRKIVEQIPLDAMLRHMEERGGW